MSIVIQTPSERIDLGSPLDVWAALADLARAAAGVEYPELWGIGLVEDEPVSDEYLAQVRAQATALLATAGETMSTVARSLLEDLLVSSTDEYS